MTVTSDPYPTLTTWEGVLNQLSSAGLTPSIPTAPHIPLLARKCGEAYSDRVDSLQGQKKDRFDRHMAISGTAAESDPDFFARMRAQGSFADQIS